MAGLAMWLLVGPAAGQARDRTVLVLFSDEGRLPATSAIYTGLEAGLRSVQPRVTLLSQYLDITNFGGEIHNAEMAAFLQTRYSATPVEVVVAVGPSASAFAFEHRPTIWPSAKIVVISFARDALAAPALAGADARVAVPMDYRSTIEAALAMLPGTRQVVLVGGASATDGRYFAQARTALSALEPRVRVVELHNLRLSAIQQRLATLGDDAIVMVAMFFQDADARSFLPAEAVRELASQSRRPVFGVHDSWLGFGSVGGLVTDYQRVGRDAAAATAALLAGGTPASGETAPRWMFDARQLARWGISDDRLPAGADLLYREPGVWSRYRWYIVVALVAIALQALIIGALLVERRARRLGADALQRAEAARRQTEVQMQLQLHDLAHVKALASIGQTTAAVAHELNQPLTAVLSNAQALRRLLARPGAPDPMANEILDDIIAEDKRAGEVIQRMRRMLKKDVYEWAPVDVNAIVQDVTRLMTPEATNAGVRLETKLAQGLPATRGDRIQLQQVMLNLVQNGVQAAAAGKNARSGVRVATALEGAQLSVRVSDSGAGITPDALPRLFDPFFTTKTNGLGLGLSISRTIVEQHGGSIAASNVSGGGAEFAVRLPRLEGTA